MNEKIKTKYYVTEDQRVDLSKYTSKNKLLISRFITNPENKTKRIEG